MKNKKLISIIVPIYNVEIYLAKCIESLISQTYKNIEIFLVDDGSPDNSYKICEKYAKKDKRIKFIRKENGGYGSVLEYAINNISGEYFLICDSDDWLEKNAVEKLVSASIKFNADFVIARKMLVYKDGKKIPDKSDFQILDGNKLYTELTPFLALPCSPHSKLYKRDLCRNINFPHKINNTDFLLYQVYLTRISSVFYLDEELSNYFIDRPGNSFNEDEKLTEKSLNSNSIVTIETYNQIDKKSKLYDKSIMHLCLRSVMYLSMIKKSNHIGKVDKYVIIFNKILDNSVKYKSKLYDYFKYSKSTSNSKLFLKYCFYSLMFNKGTRIIFIKLFNIIKGNKR